MALFRLCGLKSYIPEVTQINNNSWLSHSKYEMVAKIISSKRFGTRIGHENSLNVCYLSPFFVGGVPKNSYQERLSNMQNCLPKSY